MKKYFKYIIMFLFILFLWCLSGLLFNYNSEYYSLLNIPLFALSGKLISIIWFIIYILLTVSIMMVISKYNICKQYDYIYILLTNYFANELFMYFFFYLMSPFLGFIITVIVFITSIFLYIETKKLVKNASYLLIPYIIYNLYALILMTSVYLMNF